MGKAVSAEYESEEALHERMSNWLATVGELGGGRRRKERANVGQL